MLFSVPLIQATLPTGIYQVCTTANTDYVLTVPANATGCVIWFETSASVTTPVGGRVGVHTSDTVVSSLANTDTKLGYHPAMPVEYSFRAFRRPNQSDNTKDKYLHVACNTALAVVRGFWLYSHNEAV